MTPIYNGSRALFPTAYLLPLEQFYDSKEKIASTAISRQADSAQTQKTRVLKRHDASSNVSPHKPHLALLFRRRQRFRADERDNDRVSDGLFTSLNMRGEGRLGWRDKLSTAYGGDERTRSTCI